MIEPPAGASEALRGLLGSMDYADIDPDWPITSHEQAIALLAEWSELESDREVLVGGGTEAHFEDHPGPLTFDHHAYRLSHSHAHEWANLARYGFEGVYTRGRFTKYVAVAWHLAGRHRYDAALVEAWEKAGKPRWNMIDFGAAAWIQSCFWAKKGLWVTAVNKSNESDAQRFGRWLARLRGIGDRVNGFSSDPVADWAMADHADVIYCMDVFEHIPPLEDDSPGWIPYAKALLDALRPGGIFFANAPLDFAPGKPTPTSYHPDHFTSPISLSQWLMDNGCYTDGFLFRKGPRP